MLYALQKKYGDRIEILAGGGVNVGNAKELMERTGITQVHSSCKGYLPDPTTAGADVSYAYLPGEHAMEYETVEEEKVRAFVKSVETTFSSVSDTNN